jgi:1,2-diacylglycerol-3-alpha-glucose alpha-1,2-glucosyltransferase
VVRDIGVFDPWLVNGVSCYKGHDNDEFAELVRGTVERTLPDTREEGYKVASERTLEAVGQKLKAVYESVL